VSGTAENAVQLAAKFYEARDALRFLHGERYRSEAQPWRQVVEACMRKEAKDSVRACLHLMLMTNREVDYLWLMAVTCDITEGVPA
jgi:hypothetical protein